MLHRLVPTRDNCNSKSKINYADDQPCSRLHTYELLPNNNDQAAKPTHNHKSGNQKYHCCPEPLTQRSGLVTAQEKQVSTNCAGFDEAQQTEGECEQERLTKYFHFYPP